MKASGKKQKAPAKTFREEVMLELVRIEAERLKLCDDGIETLDDLTSGNSLMIEKLSNAADAFHRAVSSVPLSTDYQKHAESGIFRGDVWGSTFSGRQAGRSYFDEVNPFLSSDGGPNVFFDEATLRTTPGSIFAEAARASGRGGDPRSMYYTGPLRAREEAHNRAYEEVANPASEISTRAFVDSQRAFVDSLSVPRTSHIMSHRSFADYVSSDRSTRQASEVADQVASAMEAISPSFSSAVRPRNSLGVPPVFGIDPGPVSFRDARVTADVALPSDGAVFNIIPPEQV